MGRGKGSQSRWLALLVSVLVIYQLQLPASLLVRAVHLEASQCGWASIVCSSCVTSICSRDVFIHSILSRCSFHSRLEVGQVCQADCAAHCDEQLGLPHDTRRLMSVGSILSAVCMDACKRRRLVAVEARNCRQSWTRRQLVAVMSCRRRRRRRAAEHGVRCERLEPCPLHLLLL